MNAYELADELDKVQYQNGSKPFEIYANMLRQQANRIVKLEKELYFKNYYEELPDTQVGIIGKIGDSPIHDLVHRTTPQIKELSDIEISLIAEEFTGADGLDVVDFGRAILKKVSEK